MMNASPPHPGPLARDTRPADTGVEVRPLEPGRCVLSRGGSHHVVDLPAEVVQLLVLLWGRRRADLIDDELARAAEPLRRLVEEHMEQRARSWEPEPPPCPPRRPCLDVLLTGDREMVGAIVARLDPRDRVETMDWEGPRPAVNRAFALRRLLVVAVRGAREDDLIDVDRTCHDMRVPWFALEMTRGRLWAGPLVTPGTGASYEDAAARRLAAARDSRVHRVLRRPAPGGDQGAAPERRPRLIDAALDLIAQACQDLAAPEAADGLGDLLHEMADGPDGLEHLRHPVLPLPGRPTGHRRHEPRDLLDERCGLVLRVREVRHHPRVPVSLTTRQADVSDIRAITPWANNILCQGSSLTDPESAHLAAVGESVERYCGNILDTLPVTWGSYEELRRRGLPVLDPAELVLYSESQYSAPGFPFIPLTRDLRVHWVQGRRLSDEAPLLVPASMVFVNWYSAGFSGAPPTNFCSFAGIAAGPDEDFAVRGALEEIIERHATMVWWLNGHRLPAVRHDAGVAVDSPLRVRYLHLDNELGVPVAAAVVHDDEAELVNIGFSARPCFTEAASKALTEALTLQEGSRDLLRSDGLHWRVMADGELNGRAFKPWRADRRYLDDFRPDMHDCDDLMVQQQVYLDPRAGRTMAHLLEPSTVREDPVPHVEGPPLDHYRRALGDQGIEPIVVDITTSDVASTGLRVVRVIAPGMVGNAPAAFPYLGRRRVQDLAVELGWRETALKENELNYFPLPHA